MNVDPVTVAESAAIETVVTGTLRRMDGAPIEQYDEDAAAMMTLTLPPLCFMYSLDATPRSVASGGAGGGVLHVAVHRKYLPVSKSYGNAPFCFVFVLAVPPAAGGGGGVPAAEVVVTSPFLSSSKEPASSARVRRGDRKSVV